MLARWRALRTPGPAGPQAPLRVRQLAVVLSLAAIAAAFAADVLTPGYDSFSPLEVIPVALLAWLTEMAYLWAIAVAVGLTALAVRLGGDSFVTSAMASASFIATAALVRRIRSRVETVRSPWPPEPPVGAAAAPLLAGLTRREAQVARLAAGGLTARQIGASLGIGERTVETHLANLIGKLGAGEQEAADRPPPARPPHGGGTFELGLSGQFRTGYG